MQNLWNKYDTDNTKYAINLKTFNFLLCLLEKKYCELDEK